MTAVEFNNINELKGFLEDVGTGNIDDVLSFLSRQNRPGDVYVAFLGECWVCGHRGFHVGFSQSNSYECPECGYYAVYPKDNYDD